VNLAQDITVSLDIEPQEYYKNKIVFISETASKRTNESFRKQLDESSS